MQGRFLQISVGESRLDMGAPNGIMINDSVEECRGEESVCLFVHALRETWGADCQPVRIWARRESFAFLRMIIPQQPDPSSPPRTPDTRPRPRSAAHPHTRTQPQEGPHRARGAGACQFLFLFFLKRRLLQGQGSDEDGAAGEDDGCEREEQHVCVCVCV